MKRHVGLLFLSFSILIVFCACKKELSTGIGPLGSFRYKAYDSTGAAIVQGWFTLNIADSAHVRGEWHFSKVGSPLNIGPQVGDDSLQGGFYQSKLSVNLSPRFVDNNIILSGDINSSSFNGNWMWIGFPGELNRGTFQSLR